MLSHALAYLLLFRKFHYVILLFVFLGHDLLFYHRHHQRIDTHVVVIMHILLVL